MKSAFRSRADVYRLDLKRNVWEVMPRIPEAGRFGHSSCTIDGSLYLFGGTSGIGHSPMHIDKMLHADRGCPTWSKLTFEARSFDFGKSIADICPLNSMQVLIFYSCSCVTSILNIKTGDEVNLVDEHGQPIVSQVKSFFAYKRDTVLLNIGDEGCFKIFKNGLKHLEPLFT